MFDMTLPKFTNEDKAREYLEKVRWPNGPVCPHCGCYERVMTLKGKSTRPGVYKCGDCRKQFTVTVGTVFERSHIPIHKWVLATHLLCASKKGMSAHQLHRLLGVTYKTAWFMCHRIREGMREPKFDQMGGNGTFVEVDETFWGNKRKPANKKLSAFHHKEKVLTLVERDGRARSFHVPSVNAKTLGPIIRDQIAVDSAVMTDDASYHKWAKKHFAGHGVVNHSISEYVRGPIHTNTVEGFFSIFKRGLNGVYQHCSKQHLKRYLAEFDFRYSYRSKLGYEDEQRAEMALRGIEGKRLTYLPIDQKQSLSFEAGL